MAAVRKNVAPGVTQQLEHAEGIGEWDDAVVLAVDHESRDGNRAESVLRIEQAALILYPLHRGLVGDSRIGLDRKFIAPVNQLLVRLEARRRERGYQPFHPGPSEV